MKELTNAELVLSVKRVLGQESQIFEKCLDIGSYRLLVPYRPMSVYSPESINAPLPRISFNLRKKLFLDIRLTATLEMAEQLLCLTTSTYCFHPTAQDL